MSDNPARWRKQWAMERERGLTRYVSTAGSLDRIEWLINQGFTCTAIAKAAGLDRGTVLDIRSGHSKRTTSKTERKILTVTPETIHASMERKGYVPAIGSVRRIQALVTVGWRYLDLGEKLGFPVAKIGDGAGLIGRAHHEAICRLYDELWDVQGPAQIGSITRALNKGWAVPMAWDDDTIDDPNAEPFGTVREREAA